VAAIKPNCSARGYTAFQTGDLDTVRSLFAPDIVGTCPARATFAGDYKGVDNVSPSSCATSRRPTAPSRWSA